MTIEWIDVAERCCTLRGFSPKWMLDGAVFWRNGAVARVIGAIFGEKWCHKTERWCYFWEKSICSISFHSREVKIQRLSISAGFLLFYSPLTFNAQVPLRNTASVVPSAFTPSISMASEPIIKSTWIKLSFTPCLSSSSSLISEPPSKFVG